MPIANSVPVSPPSSSPRPVSTSRQVSIGKPLAIDRDRRCSRRVTPASPARSSTTMSAPAAPSASRLPPRSTPITSPKLPARPAATPELASSTTTASAGATPRLLGGVDEHRRVGLSGEVLARRRRCRRPRQRSDRRCRPPATRCGRSSTTRRSRSERRRGRARPSPSAIPGYGSIPCAGEHGVEHLVLAVSQRADRVVARRIGRVAPRQLDAAGREERLHAVVARPAVDIGQVVVARRSPTARTARPTPARGSRRSA